MNYSRLFNFIIVLAILVGSWHAFLFLVPKPPIGTTPALIMVWSSTIILILAVFPHILNRVKRFKVKDFEIELREAVEKYTTEDFISLSDINEHIFSTKGDFSNLQYILGQATRHPSKPVLLVVNLRMGRNISISMLFIYLFFLDLVGSSITILFISSQNSHRNLTDINKDSIVGAISGKKGLRVFYEQFPNAFKIFNSRSVDNISYRNLFRHEMPEFFFHELHNSITNGNNHPKFISKDNVLDWFRGQLSSRTIEVSLNPSDLKTIREALAQEDEFILSIKDKSLNSVISLCDFSKNISKKILADVVESK